jgi:hypothetical protein
MQSLDNEADFRPTSRRKAGESVAHALEDVAAGASHDFAAPVRQLDYLSIHPDILDLSLASARAIFPSLIAFILTSPQAKDATAAVAKRHFGESAVPSDSARSAGSRCCRPRRQAFTRSASLPHWTGARGLKHGGLLTVIADKEMQ